MPVCIRCSEKFPNRMMLDGKELFLNKRKYCIKCSPIGSRTGPKPKPKPENGKQCPICESYFKYKSKNNVCATCRACYRRYLNKQKAVDLLGGQCSHCNNADRDLLSFHHTQDKAFTLSACWQESWETLELEIKKCILLCHNCHAKLHKNEHLDRINKIIEYYKSRPIGETGDTRRT